MNTEDFKAGAKAMFDYLLFRAANNWHVNPVIMKACDEENAIIESWAEDALESVDPEDHEEWISIQTAYKNGFEAGYQKANRERDFKENNDKSS